MTRIAFAILALGVTAVVAFVLEVRRIAAGLELTPGAAPDDSEIVGMPTVMRFFDLSMPGPGGVIEVDWDEWFRVNGRAN